MGLRGRKISILKNWVEQQFNMSHMILAVLARTGDVVIAKPKTQMPFIRIKINKQYFYERIKRTDEMAEWPPSQFKF